MIDDNAGRSPLTLGAVTSGEGRPVGVLPDVDGIFGQHYPVDRPEPADVADVSALHERVALLESRLVEQDRMIRHTLTMLIEWIEGESVDRHAV